jgi:hypothetical protein
MADGASEPPGILPVEYETVDLLVSEVIIASL